MWSCLDLGFKLVIVAVLLVFGSPGHALAWGWEGHRIAAEIAEQFLEPGTARDGDRGGNDTHLIFLGRTQRFMRYGIAVSWRRPGSAIRGPMR